MTYATGTRTNNSIRLNHRVYRIAEKPIAGQLAYCAVSTSSISSDLQRREGTWTHDLDDALDERDAQVLADSCHRDDKSDCGYSWSSAHMKGGCPRCNGGAHGHFENGSCDTEPCYRHGGPA